MSAFLQQLVAGLSTGAIYAILALAIVMVYKATRQVNFAIGEMAMFSAFIAASLMGHGFPYWAAFVGALVFAFAAGVLVERLFIQRVEQASMLSSLAVMIGLLLIFNSLAGWIFGFAVRPFPTPFSDKLVPVSRYLSAHQAGTMLVALLVVGALYVFFERTPIGLAIRATADNRRSSQLIGIRSGRMLALGWGIASAVAAVAAMMIAPIVYLEPNTMAPILIYGFAAALVGGIESPAGAIVGGLLVGVVENLAGAFLVGPELKLVMALVLIIGVLVVKPAGLFGRPRVARV